MIGTKLAHYEITAHLGSGGMGDVYQATDGKLSRSVAIKFLPEAFSHDTERVARFQREARVLASLNHPGIAAIYGVEEINGRHFLVMELVPGETLANRIQRGPIPIEEALEIARHICEALEATHEKGVIHRDLKPANIKVTPDGKVKVLDFGLASAIDNAPMSTPLSDSPTLLSGTMGGMILGTAGYMAPEQAKGRPADKRSDVWAFGCVLYEMLTGKMAFKGEDVSDTLAAVLRAEPDWNALPQELPPAIRTLLKSCLDKDRRQRTADISTALFLMNKLPELSAIDRERTVAARPGWKRAVPVLMTAGALAAFVIGILVWSSKPSMPLTLTRFSIPLAEGQDFTNPGRHVLAVSPDGTKIAYVANQQLYLRSMSDIEAHPIPGTQFSQGVQTPVFSPDGASVAFNAVEVGIKRVPLTGGTPSMVCEVKGGLFGMSWNGDAIVFGLGEQGIKRCPANGGAAEQLISVRDDEVAHGPQMLPGGRAVLYTLAARSGDDRWERAKIVVETIGTGNRNVLIDGGTDARYLTSGHLIYAREGVLYAAPFNPERLEIGTSVSVLQGVRRGAVASNPGTAHFAISNTGTLIYIPGPVSTTSPELSLAFIDREGRVQTLNLPPRPYGFPRFSPDGKRVVVETFDGRQAAIWIIDVLGKIPPRQLTLSGKNRFPIWTSDGERVAFQSDREGDLGIWWHRADGSGTTERLTKAEPGEAHIPNSWSPVDRGTFLFTVSNGDKFSLWTYSLQNGKAARFGATAAANSSFSPDGQWVAYSAPDSVNRRRSVFLQPFPNTGETYQISAGLYLGWSSDGKELVILDPASAAKFSIFNITTRPSLTSAILQYCQRDL